MDPFERMLRYIWQLDFGEAPERTVARMGREVGEAATPAVLECKLANSLFRRSATRMLQDFRAHVLSAARRCGIDGRAIAAAITWEYEKNTFGRYTDYLQGGLFSLFGVPGLPYPKPSFSNGLSFEAGQLGKGIGWGSMHDDVVARLRPKATPKARMCMRLEAEPAIRLIGEEMRRHADALHAHTTAKVWIHDQPVALCGYYQAGDGLRRKSERRLNAEAVAGALTLGLGASAPTLDFKTGENLTMPRWVAAHLARFTTFRYLPDLPAGATRPRVLA